MEMAFCAYNFVNLCDAFHKVFVAKQKARISSYLLVKVTYVSLFCIFCKVFDFLRRLAALLECKSTSATDTDDS